MRERTMKMNDFVHKIEDLTIVRAIRDGMIHIIPVLIIGAFPLIFLYFPVTEYQNFIAEFLGGFFKNFFEMVNSATFGVLSVYMTYSISRAYMKIKSDSNVVNGGAILSSLISFFILAGVYIKNDLGQSTFSLEQMGVKSMFLAILTGLGASALYFYLYRFMQKRAKSMFTVGADRQFNRMLSTVFPIALVGLIFGLFNALIMRIFNVESFHALLINMFNAMFSVGEVGFFKGFFFVLLSSILWFFGIHGSDTLEGVMQNYFAPGLATNQAALAEGLAPTAILTKEFFDCFVLMGGCGATICLLIAILIFSRNRARKGLAFTAAFPMLFNINELMVFGLPIIFNPIMLIPFLAVPLVSYSVAYLSIATGIVPMITSEVYWTTPVLLGGYFATGSIAGSLLQLVNLVLGTAIYFPFVRILDSQTADNAKRNYDSFIEYYKANESTFASSKLTELTNVYGGYAIDLLNDLKYGLKKQVVLAYQPQYDYEGNCFGVEALLRYEHPLLGLIYPPLVIKLAEEGGFLGELEERILSKALEDRPLVLEKFGEDGHLSINVTGTTVITPEFIQFCKELDEKESIKGKNICIEITEQAAISFNEETRSALNSLKEMGFLLAIDDFSMGQTSIHYLKDSTFDIIKLDGSLVQGLFTHQNTRDIISSIVKLADSLNLIVLAEFVDSEDKKNALHEIGCDRYQGYLFSPAVFVQNY